MTIEDIRKSRRGVSSPQALLRVDEICDRVVARLAPLEGIRAIVLGGSRARGTARDDSDVDLGLYYKPEAPFAVKDLDTAASELDDRRIAGLVTPFGAWGAGVNGGGWLFIGGRHVDLLYRDLCRVRAVIERCMRGEMDAVHQIGHPLGFQNQIYAGEIRMCQPLHDPAAEIISLKQLVAVYPPSMRRALVDKHLFDAQLEIEIAAGPAERSDIAYVGQCLGRAAGFMVLVLYALNQRWFLNEKNAFIESRGFDLRAPSFHREVEETLAEPGRTISQLRRSVAAMRAAAIDLRSYCEEQYPSDQSGERNQEFGKQLAARFETKS
jgi:predicted nucleotidyltransferase